MSSDDFISGDITTTKEESENVISPESGAVFPSTSADSFSNSSDNYLVEVIDNDSTDDPDDALGNFPPEGKDPAQYNGLDDSNDASANSSDLVSDNVSDEISPVELLKTRLGGDEPETLIGTEGDDLIDGFGGNDTITGSGGDDFLI